MKEIPILYSTPMIQAKLAGRKTQTRRIVSYGRPEKAKRPAGFKYAECKFDVEKNAAHWYWPEFPDHPGVWVRNPYGKPGDLMYARETFGHGYNSNLDSNIGKEEKDWTLRYVVFKDGSQMYSDGQFFQGNKSGTGKEDSFKGVKWKPSIHMPKWSARIWDRVVSVRVERLQDISEEDAIAEGIGVGFQMNAGWPDYTRIKNGVCEVTQDDPRMSYATLWESINGPGSWEANPWVWVITTENLSLTGRPVTDAENPK